MPRGHFPRGCACATLPSKCPVSHGVFVIFRAAGPLPFAASLGVNPPAVVAEKGAVMDRKQLAMAGGLVGIVAASVAVVLLVRPAPTEATGTDVVGGDKKAVTVKVLVPQEDATVVIDGKTIRGSGAERTHKVSTAKETIEISTN